MEDLYGVLGVDVGASPDEIAQAFNKQKKRMQAMMKGAQAANDAATEEEAAAALQTLFKAHKVLGNPEKRAAYDREQGYPAPMTAAHEAARPDYAESGSSPVASSSVYSEPEPSPATPAPIYDDKHMPVLGQQPFKKKRHKERAAEPLWLAVDKESGPVYLEPRMANRHGLIAGATGTGKTVTLKVLAERFSNIGVPVFLADIKGDVWTMCEKGENSPGFAGRLKKKLGFTDAMLTDLGIDPEGGNEEAKNSFFEGCYMRYWDVYGKKGHPVRTTVSEMGPDLLARLLELNETQSGVLNIIFRYADDNNMLILDMKDLRTMVKYCSDHADELKTQYGNISAVSVGAIQRALLRLEDAGANIFFGEPALDLNDWFDYDEKGRGVINLLHCAELFQKPILYSTFLLWLLSGLYELLPEKGDADKPEIVFFFDEAHLIFKDAPKSLLSKVEQVVRLIRSKGVGVYFISQMPADIPDNVLSQLGNKIQHALRANTPKDQAAVKSAAASFRANPRVNAEKALTELGTGEALVSLMDSDGKPSMVQRAWIMPPQSYLGVLDEEERQEQILDDKKYGDKYHDTFDRVSAYEILSGKIDAAEQQAKMAEAIKQQKKQQEDERKEQARLEREQRAAQREAERQEDRRKRDEAREAARQAKEEEREYKRKLAEEEREYKRQQAEEARRQKEAEREAARQAREEEREYKRRLAEEEREYKRQQAEEARKQKEREAMLRQAVSLAKSSSVQRGLFGMLKKLF